MAPPDSPLLFPTKELCIRAIASPSSVTPAERALILNYPDPDTETSLCIAKTGLPMSGLIAKALAVPPTLTTEEAHIVCHGPVDRTRDEKITRREAFRALTDEEGDLMDRAWKAVAPPADPDVIRARQIAWSLTPLGKKVAEARQARNTTNPLQPDNQSGARSAQASTPARRKPIVLPWERADWITLVRERKFSSWGLPVLRTAYDDPAAWLTFKSKFSALAAHEMAQTAEDPIAETYTVQYIEDEEALAGADHAGLLAYYAKILQEGRLEDGFSWGVFVSADENVLGIFSARNRELIVPVWQADWKAGDVGAFGWPGALAFRAGMVFAILMPMLARGDRQPLQDLDIFADDR